MSSELKAAILQIAWEIVKAHKEPPETGILPKDKINWQIKQLITTFKAIRDGLEK